MSVILTGDWPLTTEKVGARIGQLTQAGYVRHDILVNKAAVGRLIGARGTTLQALMESTRCEIFILDKEGPPPGCSPEQRLVVVMGGDAGQVAAAAAEVENVRTSGYPAASVGEPQAYSAAAAGIGPPTAPWDAQQQQYQQAANPQQMPAMQGCQQMQQSYMQQMQPAQMGAQMGAAPQMQPQAAGMQMAAASGAASECILTGDWPLTTDKCGARIAQLMRMGHVRHDMLILKAQVGRIIGVRGSTLQALLHSTQCEIFMLDKEGAPPGCTPEQRLVVLMGNEAQVANGVDQIKNILNGGRAPQVPPLHQQQSPGFGSYQAQYQPQQTYQQQTYQQAYQPQQYQQQSAYQQQTYEQQYQQQYQGQYQQQYQQQQYQQPQQYQQQAYPQQQQQFQPQQFQPQQYQQQAYAQPAATFQQQQGGYQQAQAGYGGANGSFGSFDAGNNGQYAFGAAQAFAPPQQRARPPCQTACTPLGSCPR